MIDTLNEYAFNGTYVKKYLHGTDTIISCHSMNKDLKIIIYTRTTGIFT